MRLEGERILNRNVLKGQLVAAEGDDSDECKFKRLSGGLDSGQKIVYFL